MRTSLISILVATLCQPLLAASVQINWSTDRALSNVRTSPLSAGTAADGDGTLLQLGYYSSASLSNPFAGNWVVIATSSVGDSGVNEAGWFSTTTTLTEGSFIAPAVGTPLSIRFYDGFTAGTSTYFNAVSDPTGAWNWVAPTEPASVLNLNITKGTSVYQDGVLSAYLTTLRTGVPEPSTPLILAVSSVTIAFRRRRR